MSSPVPADLDLRTRLPRRSIIGLALAIATCVIVVVAVVSLLVVQPGKKPTPKPPSLCFDSAMQMEMPCSQTP